MVATLLRWVLLLLARVLLLWWWLAAPSREWLAARLPWVLWLLLPVPLAVLAFEPWVLHTVAMWLGPSTQDYALNPLVFVSFRIYLFVTALALATGRPTRPRVLLRLAGPWALFLGALVLFFNLSPRPVFQG